MQQPLQQALFLYRTTTRIHDNQSRVETNSRSLIETNDDFSLATTANAVCRLLLLCDAKLNKLFIVKFLRYLYCFADFF